ncbi:CorA metal ion transporter [Coemansia sp. RSA 2559]|nr:CorA metal ion transporter [Coemansia sp. RSA 2559]
MNSHGTENEWDVGALRELAETGRVASALPLYSPTYKGSHGKRHSSSSSSSNDKPLSGAESGRFTLFQLQGEGGGTCKSMSSVGAAIDEAQKKTADGFWLDVTDPSSEEMERLARTFNMHPLTVEDILADAGDTDKLEAIDDYAMLVYCTTAGGEGDMGFSIVLKRRLVLSFHSAGARAHVHNALGRLGSQRTRRRTADVVYALVDDITDSLGLAMAAIEREVAEVDALVMAKEKKEKGETLQRIGLLRRRILSIWRLLLGKPDIVRALSRLFASALDEDDEEDEEDMQHCLEDDMQHCLEDDMQHYLEDICDHLAALASACGQCELVLSRAHANYMARLSLDLSGASVDAGLFSNRWLALVGILFPLQVCISYFGQNVKIPWKMYADEGINVNLHAWFGIFGAAAGIFVLAITLARIKQLI